mmetsp:Transcript_35201/g.56584  ORF Transcript_35201/g.56584 Transcript_35201/m.56584 type:complete len:297 (-) Transcript_35201:1218-2108(-)
MERRAWTRDAFWELAGLLTDELRLRECLGVWVRRTEELRLRDDLDAVAAVGVRERDRVMALWGPGFQFLGRVILLTDGEADNGRLFIICVIVALRGVLAFLLLLLLLVLERSLPRGEGGGMPVVVELLLPLLLRPLFAELRRAGGGMFAAGAAAVVDDELLQRPLLFIEPRRAEPKESRRPPVIHAFDSTPLLPDELEEAASVLLFFASLRRVEDRRGVLFVLLRVSERIAIPPRDEGLRGEASSAKRLLRLELGLGVSFFRHLGVVTLLSVVEATVEAVEAEIPIILLYCRTNLM